MNRQMINTLVVSAVLMLVSTNAALAIDAPHNTTTCTICHAQSRTAPPNSANNLCLSCHKPGHITAGSNPFKVEDMANPFGSYVPAVPGVQTQSSHNWAAPSNVPAAGAQEPTNPLMTAKSTLNGRVSCARCHEIHADTADFPATRTKPLLRMLNDNDEMCLDCHRSRNTTTVDEVAAAQKGTHPVSFGYNDASSKAVLKPFDYYTTPQNANPANPTSALLLKNGKVVCSTCHAIHFTDSNSATVDGAASAVQGQLSTSDGFLLRTDLRGASASDNNKNICTNCHRKTNHNTTANIQCADCHAGHVEYIPPADVAAGEGKPNVYLLRRYMNYSGGVKLSSYRRKVFFQATSAASQLYRIGNGKGICEACHNVDPALAADHATATKREQCIVCHTKGPHTTDPPQGCTNCHGQPPVDAATKAAGYSIDETTTGHKTHAGKGSDYSYICTECHNGYRTPVDLHNQTTKSYQTVFVDPNGITASQFGAAPVYNPGGRQCSNVYCHSDGAPRNAAGNFVLTAKTVPNWVGGATNCTSCHGDQASLNTNAHSKHTLGKNIGCVTCHAATVSDNTTISSKANHANGVKDVSFPGWLTSNATCGTNNCHQDGAGHQPLVYPKWTDAATGACGTCHKVGTAMDTAAHGQHLTASYGPGIASCNICHDYTSELGAKHVNNVVDMQSGITTTSCAPCHPAASSINWTAGTRLACVGCHAAIPAVINSVSAPYKANFNSTGHGQFAASNQCTICHDQNSAHISGVQGDAVRLFASGNNVCAPCHDGVTARNVLTHVATQGEVLPTMVCATCHDTHGSGNTHMVRAAIKFNPLSSPYAISYDSTNFVQTSYPYRGLCQVCHTKANHFRRGMNEATAPANGYFKASGTNHTGITTGCLSCHKHNAGTFAFSPAGGECDSCHGYPPAGPTAFAAKGVGNYQFAGYQNYTGAGGAHTVNGHVSKTADKSAGFANCDTCHDPSDHNMGAAFTTVKVRINNQYRFNSALQVKYTSNRLDGALHQTGNCSNVSCHFGNTPVWGKP